MACYLCAVACPVDCIALQATEDEHGPALPGVFRINFSRCIFCGFCEEACPTYAIQLTPDSEMSEYHRPNMVYEKEDLLISGPGKYHGLQLLPCRRLAIGGKDKGEAENEAAARRPRRACCREESRMMLVALRLCRGCRRGRHRCWSITAHVALHALLYLVVSLLAVARGVLLAGGAVRGGARGHHLRRRHHGAVHLRRDAAQPRPRARSAQERSWLGRDGLARAGAR